MTNYAQLSREFNTLRDLRRSALLQTLEARELQESTSPTTELASETPETLRAGKYFAILDRAVMDVRNLLVEEFDYKDLITLYDL